MATKVTMKGMLEAGVHFGHQTRRWNPKMAPYIFTQRGGIYILDLQKTLRELDKSYSFVKNLAARGEKILFVGTKKQAQEPIENEAKRCGMPYVSHRWLGGMLTNFVTMRERVSRMEELETMIENGTMATLPKKEQQLLRKELGKLSNNLDGVRDMKSVPSALFVVDTKREEIAIREAQRLNIPVIGLVDTNSDPDEVDYLIPANDDAIRSIAMMCRVMADAVIAGSGPDAPDQEAPAEEEAPEAAAAPEEVAAPEAEPIVEEKAAEPTTESAVEQPQVESVAEAAPEAPAEETATEPAAE